MKLHGNARTCPRGRRLLVERVECGWTVRRAAGAAGVSERTAAKWCARWRAEGERGLLDRSSRPLRQPRRTPADRVDAVVRLRRLRMTAAEIAEVLEMALSTVSLILKRSGLGRRSRLEPLEPVNRYEHQRPGELVHLDVTKLACSTAPDIVSSAAVADASRPAPATSTCMSASTTTAVSSTSNCSMTSRE
jgi:transposase